MFNTAFSPSSPPSVINLNSDYFVPMNIKHLASYVLLPLVLLSAACDDLLKKELDIKQADYPPKLSVTAILDSDRSFSLRLYEAKSLASFNGLVDETVHRHVSVKLVEDDRNIFDYNRMIYFGGTNVVVLDTVVLEMQQGNKYTLTVEVDGFETVTSTATMPDTPHVDQVSIDTVNLIQKNNVVMIESLRSGYGGYWGGYAESYYGIKLSLTDDSPLPDYYSIELRTVNKSPVQVTSSGYPVYLPANNIGVSNTVLVQDNPDIEAAGFIAEGETYGLYLFDLMLISDISFAGKTANLDLFMPVNDLYMYYNRPQKDRIPDYDPDRDGEVIVLHVDISLLVKHITKETFRHYRTLAFQNQGLGFFSEPVTVSTNIENGLGCFSVCNSHQVWLYDAVYYYYPDRHYWYNDY